MNKRIVYKTGRVISQIAIGSSALILCDNESIITSAVAAVIERSENKIVIETCNSIYSISLENHNNAIASCKQPKGAMI